MSAAGKDRPASRSRSVRGAFPFGMGSLMTAAGRDENRQVHLGPNDSRRKIEGAHVAQYSWPQGPGFISATVSIDTDFIRRATRNIVVFLFGQALFGKGLKFEKVDGSQGRAHGKPP